MKKVLMLVAALILSLLPAATVRAADSTKVITQYTPGWGFAREGGTSSAGEMVSGPAVPPLGKGSAELRTTTSGDAHVFGTKAYAGTKLIDIGAISYSTYVKTGNSTIAPALQFAIDNDVTDMNNAWRGRLVYEPYYNGTVVQGQWQTWNVGSAQAKWWLSNNFFGSFCRQANPCTKADLLAAYPNIGISNVDAQVLFKAGSGWNVPFAGNVDNLRIQVQGDTDVYDFELAQLPTFRSDCTNGNFNKYSDAEGAYFRNQGTCISYLNKMRLTTYQLNSEAKDGINIPTIDGMVYRITVAGTWSNRGGELVDAECTNWQNQGWKDEVFGGNPSDLLDVQLDKQFVNWGECNTNNTYTRWFTGDGTPMNVRVFDGDVATGVQNEAWVNDNVGMLSVAVFAYPNK